MVSGPPEVDQCPCSGCLHDAPGPRRLDDGLGDAQVLQPVARGDQRLRFAADDRAEVLDLVRQRVVALERRDAVCERLPPRAVLLPADRSSAASSARRASRSCPRSRSSPRPGRSDSSCSPARSAPSSSRDAAVSESRNVPSAPFANRRLIATVSSTGKPRVAFEANACTATISPTMAPQVVDFVDHVEQDRAAARSRAATALPRSTGRACKNMALPITATIRPSDARAHDLDRLVQDGAVRAVMADEQLDAARARRLRTGAGPPRALWAIGFSSSAGTPARMHSSACSTCSWLGVASTTPSGRSLAKSSPSDL